MRKLERSSVEDIGLSDIAEESIGNAEKARVRGQLVSCANFMCCCLIISCMDWIRLKHGVITML